MSSKYDIYLNKLMLSFIKNNMKTNETTETDEKGDVSIVEEYFFEEEVEVFESANNSRNEILSQTVLDSSIECLVSLLHKHC